MAGELQTENVGVSVANLRLTIGSVICRYLGCAIAMLYPGTVISYNTCDVIMMLNPPI